HGLREPIVLYEGMILDGRNRYRACREAGHVFVERDFKSLPASLANAADAEAFVSSVNFHRRHMDTKAKRAFIAHKINRHPDISDRAIAKLASVDHKTVASVRRELRNRVEKLVKEFRELSAIQQREFLGLVRG